MPATVLRSTTTTTQPVGNRVIDIERALVNSIHVPTAEYEVAYLRHNFDGARNALEYIQTGFNVAASALGNVPFGPAATSDAKRAEDDLFAVSAALLEVHQSVGCTIQCGDFDATAFFDYKTAITNAIVSLAVLNRDLGLSQVVRIRSATVQTL